MTKWGKPASRKAAARKIAIVRDALYPINQKHAEVQGKRAYASIADFGEQIELVVIATPPLTAPYIIESCWKPHAATALI